MNLRKRALSKSDLRTFFSSCFGAAASPASGPLADRQALRSLLKAPPAKTTVLQPPRPSKGLLAQSGRTHLLPKRSKCSSPSLVKAANKSPSPDHQGLQSGMPKTKRSTSHATLRPPVDLFGRAASRQSLHPPVLSTLPKPSLHKNAQLLSPNFRKSPLEPLQGSPGRRSSTRGLPEHCTRRSIPKPPAPVFRIQNRRDGRENVPPQPSKPRLSKATLDRLPLSKGSSPPRPEPGPSKVSRLDKLLKQMAAVRPATREVGTSKSFGRHFEVNLLNSNMTELLKDLAKRELVVPPPPPDTRIAASLCGPQEDTLKKTLLQETLQMMKEHLVFESMLGVLAEKGVDTDSLLSFCYQRLHIRGRDERSPPPPRPHTTLPSESEVSLLDLAQLPSSPPPKAWLALDFEGLPDYSSSGDSEG